MGGRRGPYLQSERRTWYEAALTRLRRGGWVYLCRCSCREVAAVTRAPHAGKEDEPLYPGTCRPPAGCPVLPLPNGRFHRRIRVPEGEPIQFEDGCPGLQCFVAGRDSGDFIVWRNDDVPAYRVACVVDEASM